MTRPLSTPVPSFEILESAPAPLLAVEISVVTPLFGGGAVPRTVDADTPVRGSTVRGQLRFWWRACHAAGCPDATTLFERESAIWGTAHVHGARGGGPSAIEVAVETLSAGKRVVCAEYQPQPGKGPALRWREHYPAYALFPFQGKPNDPASPPATALEGVRFRLVLTMAPHVPADRRAELARAAEDAVWAWVTFGGIGARTRRGCGSLYCADERFRPGPDPATWLTQTAKQHVSAGPRHLPLPVLAGARFVLGAPVPPLIAWEKAVRVFQEVRQIPLPAGIAPNPGAKPNRPGRSRWPEPDSVRQQTGISDPRHPPVHRARPYYPRADLGLPIIFQQMGPHEPRLEGGTEGAQRLASPVVVKPLAISASEAVPLILVLEAPHVWDPSSPGVRLAWNGGSHDCSPNELNDAGKNAAVQPLTTYTGVSSARDLVLAHAASRWAQAIRRL